MIAVCRIQHGIHEMTLQHHEDGKSPHHVQENDPAGTCCQVIRFDTNVLSGLSEGVDVDAVTAFRPPEHPNQGAKVRYLQHV